MAGRPPVACALVVAMTVDCSIHDEVLRFSLCMLLVIGETCADPVPIACNWQVSELGLPGH